MYIDFFQNYHHHMALQPNSGPGLPLWGLVTITFSQAWIVSPGPNSQPGGPGLNIYDPRRQGGPATPQALGTHFSRLLRHAWVTVGLFFNPSFKTTKKVILSEISGSHGSKYKLYSLLECKLQVILKCSENEVSSHFHSLLINFIHSTFQTITWVNKQEIYQQHWKWN
jgi:hypothetical protein